MEPWRNVWRNGAAPVLSTDSLKALHLALASDDPRLVQRMTTSPPPMVCTADWPVVAACLLAYPGVCELGGFCQEVNPDRTLALPTRERAARVEEVEEYFAQLCYEIDARMGETAACRWLLNYFDETPRAVAFRELLAEVDLALEQRRAMT